MLLSVENLRVKYGNIEALHGISFQVDRGEIVTLIGANGAGKTTTLMSVLRLPPPEAPWVVAGEILFDGKSLLGVETHDVGASCTWIWPRKAGASSATFRSWRT
jgi:branched-chain amino acid transport system ATP-binding protein